MSQSGIKLYLGYTALDKFTADESETVLAHELGHHTHKDLSPGIIVNR